MVQDAREEEQGEGERQAILELYAATRTRTEALAGRLSPEDQQLQSMPEASPTKWHRAHTTWFFEAFVLEPEGTDVVDTRYARLFNSYYEAIGPRHPRAARGLLSRPSAVEIGDYRRRVDEAIARLVLGADRATLARILPLLSLGVAHEEQHQELLLTDILHAFAQSSLRPAYQPASASPAPAANAAALHFVSFEGGVCEVGAPGPGDTGFVFDNEQPRHKRWLEPFLLADRLVTVEEVKAFIEDGGYEDPSLWLADGFDFVRANGVTSPLYTRYVDGHLLAFTLEGERSPGGAEPAAHLSYYEADAIARFLGARLPTEVEWELAATSSAVRGNFAESGALRPLPVARAVADAREVSQLFGDTWEWTSSGYEPYPGFHAWHGALGEYNGKFMVNQVVLRGGSCLTPRRHVRASYRNFWNPGTRFQMAGVRLARGAS
jgi:ergothioneine biosynthesis protein EgtB